MNARVTVSALALALAACSGKSDPGTPSDANKTASAPATPGADATAPTPVAPDPAAAAAPSEAGEAAEPDSAGIPDKTIVEKVITEEVTEQEVAPGADAIDGDGRTDGVLPAAGEIAIQPWSSRPRTQTWTLLAEPSEAVALVDLNAGVLGKTGSGWVQLDQSGALAPVTMDREPVLPIMGVWPSDAWYVEQRVEEMDDGFEYLELRLMKLRSGTRWVPQVYDGGGGEQWYHPGTEDEALPRMSTRSGMLVFGTFEDITRVAGSGEDPMIGPHRGDVVDFIEAGSGKIYVLSRDGDSFYAQIECEDDECVAAQAMKLPLSGWTFARQVPRGKHSVSVFASSSGRTFILHQRGKSGGWLLDELPAGEQPSGMWASEEGGLWTLTGGRLRLRDTESVWYDVALPEGLSGPTVAVSEDRKRVVVAGVVGGKPKLFATEANAPAPATPPAP